jgi:hypothetical protein
MLSTTEWLGVLPKLDNSLLQAQEQLNELLAAFIPGQEPKWVGVLQNMLARTEETLRQRLVRAEAPEPPRATVGPVQASLDRQQAQLGDRYGELLEECRVLLREVDTASADGRRVDWEGMRQRANHLLAGLQQTTEREMKLVHETVNTELGAGD